MEVAVRSYYHPVFCFICKMVVGLLNLRMYFFCVKKVRTLLINIIAQSIGILKTFIQVY